MQENSPLTPPEQLNSSPQSGEVSTNSSNDGNNSKMLVIGAVVACVAFGVGGYMLGTRQLSPVSTTQIASDLPVESASQEKAVSPKSSKIQYSENSEAYRFLEEHLPELANTPDEQLVGMKCSARVVCKEDSMNCSYTSNLMYPNQPEQPVTDQRTLDIFALANNRFTWESDIFPDIDKGIDKEAVFCEVEDGRTIVQHRRVTEGAKDFVGVVGRDMDVSDPTNFTFVPSTVVNLDYPYFACSGPIMLTTTNDLYLYCGSGDGTSGSTSIVKVNLNHPPTVEEVKMCPQELNTDTGVWSYQCE